VYFTRKFVKTGETIPSMQLYLNGARTAFFDVLTEQCLKK